MEDNPNIQVNPLAWIRLLKAQMTTNPKLYIYIRDLIWLSLTITLVLTSVT